MKNGLVTGIALLLAFALGGCFATHKSLIDPKTAAHPFPSGMHYIQYFDNGSGWKETGRGTLTIKDGWYVATVTGQESDATSFLLQPWGKNYLAVAKGKDNAGGEIYLYGILKPDSGAFLEYGPDCATLNPDALKKKGLITLLNPGKNQACAPVSVAALGAIMQMVLDSKAKPDNKYVPVK